MPNRVSLCIQINDIGGLIQALAIMVAGHSTIFKPLDPFGRAEDSITQGNVEVGDLSAVDDEALRSFLEAGFVMQDVILKAIDLSLEAFDFDGCLCLTSGDCGEEAVSNHVKDVWVELRMGSKGHCNSSG